MDIVADASVFLSVILNENDREWAIRATTGRVLASPDVLPYEIGNALVAMKRKGRLLDREVLRAFDVSQRITVRLVPVSIREAMRIAMRFNIYAYDAYYLQCCIENKASLISLDARMCDIAGRLGIRVVR
jgi:predicted nucleic acid-binding protein